MVKEFIPPLATGIKTEMKIRKKNVFVMLISLFVDAEKERAYVPLFLL
jgi:hypothetical protein